MPQVSADKLSKEKKLQFLPPHFNRISCNNAEVVVVEDYQAKDGSVSVVAELGIEVPG